MAKIALYLHGKTIPEQIQIGNNMVTKMTGNPNFTTPNPSLKQIAADIDDLQTDYDAAIDGGKALKIAMHLSRKTFMSDMSLLMMYIQVASGGDPNIITSSGGNVARTPSKTSKLSLPANLRAELTGIPGTLLLKWKNVKKAASYKIEIYAEPASSSTTASTSEDSNNWNWQLNGTSTVADFKVLNLQVGTRYWFHVQAIGPNKTSSGWSNPVSMIAQ
jgi:hypothetical protein